MSATSFSRLGGSWTRYMTGAFFASSARAAATLAAIMIILDQPVRIEPVARRDRE